LIPIVYIRLPKINYFHANFIVPKIKFSFYDKKAFAWG
jgi:hypothetical protein